MQNVVWTTPRKGADQPGVSNRQQNDLRKAEIFINNRAAQELQPSVDGVPGQEQWCGMELYRQVYVVAVFPLLLQSAAARNCASGNMVRMI